jgi:hypothetical protein
VEWYLRELFLFALTSSEQRDTIPSMLTQPAHACCPALIFSSLSFAWLFTAALVAFFVAVWRRS